MPPDDKPLQKPQQKADGKALPNSEDKQAEASMQRAVNTAENAQKAVSFARAMLGTLAVGKVWRHTAPRGELEIKGALNLDGEAVCVLHFSPEDGSLLPKGLHALAEGKPEAISIVESKLKKVSEDLTVLDGAEFREPESCWAIPVAHQGRIVAHLKVSADGSKILPDRKAIEESGRAGA